MKPIFAPHLFSALLVLASIAPPTAAQSRLPGSSPFLLHEFASPNAEVEGRLGSHVAAVPDTDGDGAGDLLVATGYEDLGTGLRDAGRVYLYSGATGDLLYELISPHPEPEGRFGRAIAGVPDVDGDGRGDLLVGAYFEDLGATLDNAGRAYLFSGATGMLLYELQSPNSQSLGRFGVSVAGVPDADGDGAGELLIGAFTEDVGGVVNAGQAYLFSGATGALLFELTTPNPEISSDFGYFVAAVPDTDGDGAGDLLIGAPREDPGPGLTDAGRAYLFSGATGALLHTLTSPDPSPAPGSANFGLHAAGVPDTDGDGRGDLLVGAWVDDPGASPADAGRAYLFSGATGALLHTLQSPNEETGGRFGHAVASVPDTDGDGAGDLLIGAFTEDDGSIADAGRAYLFSGASGTLLFELASPNAESTGGFGYGVAGVPDLNGDGAGDLLVGTNGEDPGASPENAGRAYVFSGAPGEGCAENVFVTFEANTTTVPSSGGTVTFDLTVTNAGSQACFTDCVVIVKRPRNRIVFSDTLDSGTIAPGGMVVGTYDLDFPAEGSNGLYKVVLVAGEIATDTEYDRERVDVTKGGTASSNPAAALLDAPSVSPNPFSGEARITFALDAGTDVRLAIYDVLGREVAVLVDGRLDAGPHTATFEAGDLAAGVYVWRLAAGTEVQTGRITLTR